MTHTPGPWTASWAPIGIAALHDSEGKHFANFRNVRGDDISTVSADLAVVLAAPKLLAALRDLIALMGPLEDVAHIRRKHAALAAIAEAEGGAT